MTEWIGPVLRGLIRRAVLGAVTATGPALFRDRTRSAKRLAQQIAETTRLRGPRADGRPRRQRLYRRLLAIARASQRQAVPSAEAQGRRGVGRPADRMGAGGWISRPISGRVGVAQPTQAERHSAVREVVVPGARVRREGRPRCLSGDVARSPSRDRLPGLAGVSP
jgi:hypothetical protein